MATPRSQIIDLNVTLHYHVMARCVRRGFLCGDDLYSGRHFDHRKQWLHDLLAKISHVYCIELMAYAIMSNPRAGGPVSRRGAGPSRPGRS